MFFLKLLILEFKQNIRRYNDIFMPLWFLILSMLIFSIGFKQDSSILKKTAPSIIWVSVLLSLLLSANQLFTQDDDNGFLEQVLLSPTSLLTFVWVKAIIYWLKICLPLLLLLPVIGISFSLSYFEIKIIAITLLLGTPSFVLFATLGAAIILRAHHNAILLSLLILPLCIPILIFGLSIIDDASCGLSFTTPLCFLSALLLTSATLLPFVTAFALRTGIHYA